MVAIFEDFTTQVNYEAANLGLQDLYKNLSMVCCMQKKINRQFLITLYH